MKLSTLMALKAFVCFVFGIPVLLAPAKLSSLFDAELNQGGVLMARLYGASLLGNLALTWFARKDSGSPALKATVLDHFVYNLTGFIVALAAVLSWDLSLLCWIFVVIYLFFTVGFGYFQFVKPPF